MANGIRTGDPHGFNKGRSSKFREGSRVRQIPEKNRRTYRPKRCGNSNEDNSPKTFNDKNNMPVTLFSNEVELICMNTVKWFQIWLSNTYKSIWYWSFVCIQLNCFKCIDNHDNFYSIQIWKSDSYNHTRSELTVTAFVRNVYSAFPKAPGLETHHLII